MRIIKIEKDEEENLDNALDTKEEDSTNTRVTFLLDKIKQNKDNEPKQSIMKVKLKKITLINKEVKSLN